MAEQVILAVGDMCGPARKNPGAEATAAVARRILTAHPGAMILALGDNARIAHHGILKLTLRPGSYRWEFIDVADRVLDTGEQPTNQRGT